MIELDEIQYGRWSNFKLSNVNPTLTYDCVGNWADYGASGSSSTSIHMSGDSLPAPASSQDNILTSGMVHA